MATAAVAPEWAAITTATAVLRARVSSAIAATLADPDRGGARLIGRTPQEVREAMPSLEPLATTSVWSLVPGPTDPRGLAAALTEQSRARGVDLRSILDIGVLATPVAACDADHVELLRVAPVETPMILIDQRLVMVPGPPVEDGLSPSGWLLEEEAAVAAACELWQVTLERSAPLPDRVVLLTSRQREVAQLLLRGETDAVIAGKLGVSVRTVAGEVRFLMNAVGARSRYQTALRLFSR